MKTSHLLDLCITIFTLQNVSNAVRYIGTLDSILMVLPGRIKKGRILPHKINQLIKNIIWDEILLHFVIDLLKK